MQQKGLGTSEGVCRVQNLKNIYLTVIAVAGKKESFALAALKKALKKKLWY